MTIERPASPRLAPPPTPQALQTLPIRTERVDEAAQATDRVVASPAAEPRAASSTVGTSQALAKPSSSTTETASGLDLSPAAVIARISKNPAALADYPDHIRNNLNIVGHFLKNMGAMSQQELRRNHTVLFYAGDKL